MRAHKTHRLFKFENKKMTKLSEAVNMGSVFFEQNMAATSGS